MHHAAAAAVKKEAKRAKEAAKEPERANTLQTGRHLSEAAPSGLTGPAEECANQADRKASPEGPRPWQDCPRGHFPPFAMMSPPMLVTASGEMMSTQARAEDPAIPGGLMPQLQDSLVCDI